MILLNTKQGFYANLLKFVVTPSIKTDCSLTQKSCNGSSFTPHFPLDISSHVARNLKVGGRGDFRQMYR